MGDMVGGMSGMGVVLDGSLQRIQRVRERELIIFS